MKTKTMTRKGRGGTYSSQNVLDAPVQGVSKGLLLKGVGSFVLFGLIVPFCTL